jgi:hypothetical protein
LGAPPEKFREQFTAWPVIYEQIHLSFSGFPSVITHSRRLTNVLQVDRIVVAPRSSTSAANF